MRLPILALALAMLALPAQAQDQKPDSYKGMMARYAAYADEQKRDTITAEELYDLVQAKKITVLDVRSEKEYQFQHIPGAISADISSLTPERMSQLVPDKSTPIAVYCVGFPTRMISPLMYMGYPMLRDMGYTNVKLMEAGMLGWNMEVQKRTGKPAFPSKER